MLCLARTLTRPTSLLRAESVVRRLQIAGDLVTRNVSCSPSTRREDVAVGGSPGTNNFSKYANRTHTCGELRAEHVGKKVKLAGWITFKRFDLRFVDHVIYCNSIKFGKHNTFVNCISRKSSSGQHIKVSR